MNKLIHKPERLEDFEKQKLSPQRGIKNKAGFLFFSSADCLSGNTIPYRRRDFYKVSLLRGEYIVHYGDESIKAFGTSLSFFIPSIPYTIEELNEDKNAGYFFFSEEYYDTFFKQSVKNFPLFNEDFKPIFILNKEQEQEAITLFSKIEKQSLSDYSFKDDLVRNHLNELMHFANKLSPASEKHHNFSSKERLHTIFNELLDRQFPADIKNEKLLRTASDFADVLNVHVNYLNRTLKEIRGKSTSTLIYERLLKESVILLKHTNWNVADIAYSLGFKDSSHFNHFFRKQTNAMPSDYRK